MRINQDRDSFTASVALVFSNQNKPWMCNYLIYSGIKQLKSIKECLKECKINLILINKHTKLENEMQSIIKFMYIILVIF